MQPPQFDGRSHGSVRHQRTSTEELRALGAWSFSLLASGLSFGTAKGADLSRPAEAPATPGEIIPEWWATSSRNGGRDHLGMVGGIIPESWAARSRNPHRLVRAWLERAKRRRLRPP